MLLCRVGPVGTVIEENAVSADDPYGNERLVFETGVDRLDDGADSGVLMDTIYPRELGDDRDVFVHAIDVTFDVHRDLTRQQELLLVKLVRHFLLERLVKELPENDNKGQDDEKGKNKSQGGEKSLLT